MAYASLLSVTQTLEQILQSHESRLFLHKEKLLMTSLHQKLCYLLLFLENSYAKKSEIISSLEERIRDAAYEAEDVIESHMMRKIEPHIKKSVLFQGVISCFREIIVVLQHCARCLVSTSQTFEENLQNIIEKISLISKEVEEMTEYNNSDEAAAVKEHGRNSSGVSSLEVASTDKSSMVGFEEDMLRIKEILIVPSTQLETIFIVGMGGIGKTTLARNIYNDSSVNRHFDIQAWITVSQEYNMVALLEGLLRSTGGATIQVNEKDEAELKLKLYQSLKQKRYLIVMDDVWDDVVLEKFRNIFPDDKQGSRIIMTSRSSKVASSGNSCNHIHHLNFLSLDQSWNLLCQKAFVEERCPPELEDIGKRIAENCGGLALSLVAIGGVLHRAEKTLAHWEYVAENVKYAETGNYDNLMEVLSWSYNHLPHHLKACFLYMAVFPEAYAIYVTHLIMLWVANGFIKPVSSKTLEEVGKDYVEDLIDRNLIMVDGRSYDGGEIKTCVLHDLTRHLCIRKAEEEKFLLVIDKDWKISPRASKRYRHLTITCRSTDVMGFEDFYDSTFRSILYFGDLLSENVPFQLLKVFDACQKVFPMFPIELVQLVNLRYIALVCQGVDEIPASICKLRNLQVLLVFMFLDNHGKIILHSGILKMLHLRHLWVQGGILYHSSGGPNENLQTLCGVKNFVFTKKALERFPNLKTLGVSFDETEWRSHGIENLVHLCQLEYLKLRILDSIKEFPLGTNLAFPVKLRKLSLGILISLSQRQMSTIGSLPNLEVLKLKYVEFDREEGWKTNEGEFPKLKLLLLQSPFGLSWELEGAHLPSLECLTLKNFESVDFLPSEIGEIPNLKVINLYQCPSSVVTAARNIQKELLEDWGDDRLRVHVYSEYAAPRGGSRK